MRVSVLVALLPAVAALAATPPPPGSLRRLPVGEYRDRMQAGWLGQMVGVAWGAPTEFKYRDAIMPEEAMPAWEPRMINAAFGQDDLYVEMTFLHSLEQHGLDCPIREAGIEFAATRYPLWCANASGRRNLRRGIAPPDSGHPRFNPCPNDIDYQIEADYSGLVAPGMPNAAIALGETFGRLMNYGDGVYAGQFVGALYAEAFFETDLRRIIERALHAIPADSQYAEMVRDMLGWSRELTRWEDCWERCQGKYRRDPGYQKASNGGIDCKINGAYVLMGLLYGAAEPERTITIACRCGQDSDCNPSTAAGVLFTTLGRTRVPDRFTRALDPGAVFHHTPYSFPALLTVCERLARQAVVRGGGRIETGPGGEVFLIAPENPRPSPSVRSWSPGPIANSRFTTAERTRIEESTTPAGIREAVATFAPGWTVRHCGEDMNPGLHDQALGRSRILVTHPLDADTPCALSRELEVAPGAHSALLLTVGHHPRGDWELVVRADGRELLRRTIGRETATDGWVDFRVDLSDCAGRTIALELLNQPTGWAWEAGYWQRIAVTAGDGRPVPEHTTDVPAP
ncbi:MAG: ADP-ribosylglycohydrolase family protein [Lentisphaeria bacterium]|nr:ADP-ribosylglycohydrolase family protein [Lentisphaeria bacterium]